MHAGCVDAIGGRTAALIENTLGSVDGMRAYVLDLCVIAGKNIHVGDQFCATTM